MQPIRKPTWQQATALVSLSTCGAMTGFAFAHGSVDDMTSPTRMPVHLVALTKPDRPAATADSTLRSAIVDVANKYLRLARNKTPAQMEALIWGTDSEDGVDHGESCAAFASLTLGLGARAAGQQSWVTGGTSYPWPLHQWADVRVDPNPDSLNVISVLQDAQAHNRWHPLGDGYDPQPGDWVLFDGHVEVVTGYSDGVLHTIGGDSLPNFSVNAHQYSGSLSGNGVAGFVNNGELLSVVSKQPASAASQSSSGGEQVQNQAKASLASSGGAQIPGLQTAAAMTGTSSSSSSGSARHQPQQHQPQTSTGRKGSVPAAKPAVPASTTGSVAALNGVGTASTVTMPGTVAGTGTVSRAISAGTSRSQDGHADAVAAAAAIPGVPADTIPASPGGSSHSASSTSSPAYTRNNVPSLSQTPGTAAQHAFINQIAPGAMAAQSRYGVPAAVTIAQAIDESGWGQSELAARDHNLFGIKGTGPAGTDMMPTREFVNGRYVTQTSGFRVYRNIAESIGDHAQLLATGSSYQRAMADRHLPDAFANDLTGVYATDPSYGSSLIQIMQLYNLYRYDAATSHALAAPSSATLHGSGTKSSGTKSSGTHASASQAAGTQSSGTHGASSPGSAGEGSAEQRPAGPGSASAATGHASATTSLGGTAAVAVPDEGAVGQSGSGTLGATGTASPAPTASASPAATGSGSAAVGSGSAAAGSGSATGCDRPGAAGSPSSAGRQRTSSRSSGSSASSRSTGRAASTSHGAGASRSARTGSGAQSVAGSGSGRSAQGTTSGASGSGSGGSSSGLGGSAGQGGGTSAIPGVLDAYTTPQVSAKTQASAATGASRAAQPSRPARVSPRRPQAGGSTLYKAQIPQTVTTAYISTAKAPLSRAQPLYEDVASSNGIRWELLAACDWMQCQAQPRYSPVHGEKLGSKAGGTVYRTKSEALAQCASDLVELAMAVYWIDITARRRLSVRELAQVYAAFRWGGLLKLHDISALEFPYSVAGLTSQHLKMRWPDIKEPNAPDKPGSRFRMPFGAVPVVLSLGYRAIT